VDISPTFKLELWGGNEVLGPIRAWAASTALTLGADEQAVTDFALAISEATSNAVRHAYVERHQGPLVITARRVGERIVFRLRDFGRKFDPSAVRVPDIEAGPNIGGYGIYLMRGVMDNVYYVTEHPRGTEVILIRRCSS